ncbi:MAG: SAM-dependent chlorinase/fluorinase [Chloroflexota bacterium]
MVQPIVALVTDLNDAYAVVVLKADILKAMPGAEILDVRHDIEKGNVREAAFCLAGLHGRFPDNVFFLVLVGSSYYRADYEVVAIRTDLHDYVAANDGVLSYVLQHIAEKYVARITIEQNEFANMPEKRSPVRTSNMFIKALWTLVFQRENTDFFVGGAQYITPGELYQIDLPFLSVYGDVIAGEVMIAKGNRYTTSIGRIEQVANNRLKLSSDLHKNLPQIELNHNATVTVGDITLTGLRNHYEPLDPGQPHAVIGLSGYLELVLPDDIRLNEGDRVTLTASMDTEHTGDS